MAQLGTSRTSSTSSTPSSSSSVASGSSRPSSSVRGSVLMFYLFALFLFAVATAAVQASHPPVLAGSSATLQPTETRSRKPLAILQNSKHSCALDEFRCINGMCILSKWACDTYDDCGDWTDEFNCTGRPVGCPSNRFDCGQGQCISKEFVCDGEKDCSNGMDEVHCDLKPCPGHGEFRCSESSGSSAKCLPSSAKCDGVVDCPEGSDERGCVTKSVHCGHGQFKCKSGSCIEQELVCNNEKDCEDGSDEVGCLFCVSGQFPCKSLENNRTSKCIPKMYLCDGLKDCEDGSDETLPECKSADGTSSSQADEDKSSASSGHELDKTPQADVPVQCSRNQFTCRNNGACIDYRLRCDRQFDCTDGSDEDYCGPSMSAFPSQPTFQTSSSGSGSGSSGSGSSGEIDLKVYDTPQSQMVGHDVVFRCRDEGSLRASVSWSRKDGKPFPPKTTDVSGRLTMYNITPGEAGAYVCSVNGRPMSKEGFLTVTPRPGGRGAYDTDSGAPPEFRRAPQTEVCGPSQIKCRNGECIPRDAVCNGHTDCKDNSDETSCHVKCKFDEFKCDSNQCVRKNNRCDGYVNCLDGSDERTCQKGNGINGLDHGGCHYNEFKCSVGGQCVPDSYRCDGYFDCKDGSDELRCQSPRFIKPVVQTITAEEGSLLTLNCSAAGEPTPVIVWRYNMDYIGQMSSSKITFCTSSCENCPPNVVIGTMSIKDLALADEGLYTCEAANQMKGVLAPMDTLVLVSPRRGQGGA